MKTWGYCIFCQKPTEKEAESTVADVRLRRCRECGLTRNPQKTIRNALRNPDILSDPRVVEVLVRARERRKNRDEPK